MNRTRRCVWIVVTVGLFCLLGTATAQAETLAWWRFDEGTAGTSPTGTADEMVDSSGNAHHGQVAGTASNLVYGDDAFGRTGAASLSFSGTSTTVQATDDSALHAENAITIEAFVNYTNTGGRKVIASRWGDTPQRAFIFAIEGDKLRLFLGHQEVNPDNSMGTYIQAAPISTNTIATGQWVHVAATWDGTESGDKAIRLYINGVEDSATDTFNTTIAYGPGSYPIVLGAQTAGGGSSFSGGLDEVRISNVALTPDQFLPNAVPEPSTWTLLGILGVAILSVGTRRRRP